MLRPLLRVGMTGATGFIGRHVSVRLIEAGCRVRVLARDPVAAARRLHTSTEIVPGDMDSCEALRSLVEGMDAVVHLAGAVRGNHARDFDRVNVGGTARLLAALKPGTALLHMSSLAAREPCLSDYSRSKHHAEELVRGQCARFAILRPPAVYGPGDTEMLPVFRFMARTGLAPVAGALHARFSLLHVDDLARAVLALLDSMPAHTTYTLHDGKAGGYGWQELCAIASRVAGRPMRPWHVPEALLDIIAQGNRLAARAIGYAPMLTPEKVRELRHPDWVCDNADITRDIGWRPGIGLEDGLRRCGGWC